MRKRFRAAPPPAVVVATIVGAGSRALDPGPGRRLDELGDELGGARPAAAPHFPVEGVLSEAGPAALTSRWIEHVDAARIKSPAPTGRGGGNGGRCEPGSIVEPETQGDPNAVNSSSGAGGRDPFLPSTKAGSGGHARAQDAPQSVPDERFDQVWAGGAGSSHWGC